MSTANVMVTPWPLARLGLETFPTVIAVAGEPARRRFLEFFTTHIRSRNTDMAYVRAVVRFLKWCEAQGWQLEHIEPMGVATYLEHLQGHVSASTVRQHLAIIRQLFDWLVVGQVLSQNPARPVRWPASAVPRGALPV
jgi:site-specific recombinase XerD